MTGNTLLLPLVFTSIGTVLLTIIEDDVAAVVTVEDEVTLSANTIGHCIALANKAMHELA